MELTTHTALKNKNKNKKRSASSKIIKIMAFTHEKKTHSALSFHIRNRIADVK
jgi:hypothetical protein